MLNVTGLVGCSLVGVRPRRGRTHDAVQRCYRGSAGGKRRAHGRPAETWRGIAWVRLCRAHRLAGWTRGVAGPRHHPDPRWPWPWTTVQYRRPAPGRGEFRASNRPSPPRREKLGLPRRGSCVGLICHIGRRLGATHIAYCSRLADARPQCPEGMVGRWRRAVIPPLRMTICRENASAGPEMRGDSRSDEFPHKRPNPRGG